MKAYDRYLENLNQYKSKKMEENQTEAISQPVKETVDASPQPIIQEEEEEEKSVKRGRVIPLIEAEEKTEKKESIRKTFYIRKSEKKLLEKQAKSRNMNISPYIRKIINLSDEISEFDKTILLDKSDEKNSSALVCVYMYKEEVEKLKQITKKHKISESGFLRAMILLNEL